MDLGTLRGTLMLDDSPFDKTLDKAHEKVRNWGSTGAKIAAGAGVAIGVGIAGSLAGAMNLQPTRNKLRAQLNLSAKDSAKVGQVAGRLFGNAYGDSLGQVNDAVKSVGQNMVSLKRTSSTELESITAKVLDVSNAFDQDLNKTTSAAGTLMRTGLAKNATQAMDIITRGLQGPANKADDLLDTFNEYGTQFRKLGLDGPTALGLLDQAVQAGARDSDVAADAIKEFSIRAIDGSKLSAQGFKGLGLNAKDMAAQIAKGGPAAEKGLGTVLERLRGIKDPVKQAQIATALFGTQAEDLGGALFAMVPERAAKDVGKLGGAAVDMGKKLNDNASSNIESFKRKAQLAFVDTVGGKILPIVTTATAMLATQFGPALRSIADFMGRHQRATAGVLIGLGSLLGVMLAVAGVMRLVSAATAAWALATRIVGVTMKVASVATKAWAAAQWLINVAMSANPIGIIIVLLAALVGGIIIAYKRSETFRNIVHAALHGAGRAFTWLWGKAQQAFGWLKKHWPLVLAVITGPIGLAVLWVVRHWDKIKAKFRAVWEWVKGAFRAGWALLQHYIVNPVVKAYNWVTDRLARLRARFAAIKDWALGAFARAWARLDYAIHHPIEAAKNAISRIIDGVKRIFKDGVQRIGEIWDGIKAKTKKPVSFIINTVINKGLLGGYNWVAEKLHLPHIDPVKIKGFRTGGPTGRGADHDVAGVVHGNEHVATAAEVRATPGGHATWARMRNLVRAGIYDWLPGYFLGGAAPVSGGVSGRHRGYPWARWAGDFHAGTGTPVHAWKAGNVAAVHLWNHSYGHHVRVNHPGNEQTLYAHLRNIIVRIGQSVRSNQVLGYSDSTGNSTGPHLHFELKSGHGSLGGSGGQSAIVSWLGKFADPMALLRSKVGGAMDKLKDLGSSPWANLVKAVPHKILDGMIDKVKGAWESVSAGPGGVFTSASGGSNRAIGKRMMLQRWGLAQWPFLNALWNKESGWRTTARNPSSGAYGIPQSLPASKMASAGSDWRTNPATQIKWGLGYIASTYGSPLKAWGHSKRTGWYANGTNSAPSGFGWTSEKGAELVVNPQLRKYSGGEKVYDAKQTKKMLGGLGAQVQQTNYFPATMDPQAAAEAAGGRLAVTLRANGW